MKWDFRFKRCVAASVGLENFTSGMGFEMKFTICNRNFFINKLLLTLAFETFMFPRNSKAIKKSWLFEIPGFQPFPPTPPSCSHQAKVDFAFKKSTGYFFFF